VSEPATVRVTTYNVRGFRDGVGAVAAVVEDLAPDVLLLQETGPRRALAAFARDAGLLAAADPRSPLRRRVKDAVLVRPPWSIAEHRLTRFAGGRWWYPRGCLAARIEHPDGRAAWAVSVHLGLDGPERGRHARELVGLLGRLEPEHPVVVGGDLNVGPDAGAVATIAAAFPDVAAGGGAPTFPASAPTARIDHLFASASLRVVGQTTGASGAGAASDHLPVTVELAWTGRPAPGDG
jgi:endonuclease/exonuclease/phosphatase family metal-dependent hydrolase